MSKSIEKKLLKKHTRPTSMRILVYDFLAAQTAALSLSELEEALYPADRITLYRTLKTFEKKGIVHSIQENNTSKYSLCAEACRQGEHQDRHLHFYCTQCRETTCREEIRLPEHIEGAFRIDEIRLFAKGICETCLKGTLQ